MEHFNTPTVTALYLGLLIRAIFKNSMGKYSPLCKGNLYILYNFNGYMKL